MFDAVRYVVRRGSVNAYGTESVEGVEESINTGTGGEFGADEGKRYGGYVGGCGRVWRMSRRPTKWHQLRNLCSFARFFSVRVLGG